MAHAHGHRLLLVFSTTMAVLIATVGPLRAGESARLAYLRGEGAGQCADEKGLRLAVAVRLGYDPFVAWAPKTVHANVSRDAGRLRARVYLAAEDGRAQGSRELFAGIDECDKLLAAVALAISIAIDPMSLGAPPADAKSTPPVADASDLGDAGAKGRRGAATAVASTAAMPVSAAQALTPPEPHDAASPKPSRASNPGSALQWFGGLGFAVATGALPDLSIGLDIYARLGIDRVSIAVEGRYQLPASTESASGSGSVEARLYVASIEPCYRLAPLFFCGLATVGLFHAKGEGVTNPLEEQSLYWAAGGRAAIEAQVWAPFFVRGHLDLVGNGTRLALALDGLEVWRAPAVALAAGVTAVARF